MEKIIKPPIDSCMEIKHDAENFPTHSEREYRKNQLFTK
jgi:hypothetical protein